MNHIRRIIRRHVYAQVATSRNMREGWLKRCRRAFWLVVYLGKAVATGLRWTRRECLGSEVEFEGRRCWISNWSNSETPALSGGDGFYRTHVPREQIRNVRGVRELIHRFESGVGFYTANWMGIDIHKRLYPELWNTGHAEIDARNRQAKQ